MAPLFTRIQGEHLSERGQKFRIRVGPFLIRLETDCARVGALGDAALTQTIRLFPSCTGLRAAFTREKPSLPPPPSRTQPGKNLQVQLKASSNSGKTLARNAPTPERHSPPLPRASFLLP